MRRALAKPISRMEAVEGDGRMATLRSKARCSAAASFALPLSLRIVTAKGALYRASCGDDLLAKGTQSKAPMVKTAIMIQASLIA